MKKIHLIWDFDGTLVDSAQDVFTALDRAIEMEGLSKKDQIAPFRIGPTIDKILEISFPTAIMTKEKRTSAVARFRQLYDNCGFAHTVPFAGIETILKNRSVIHHVLTNKPDMATNTILDKTGLKKYFFSVITPYSFMKKPGDRKQSKTELFAYFKGLYPGDTLIGIGDMATDCIAAKENGLKAIGVLWGTGTRQELEQAGCDDIVNSPAELEAVLKVL